MRAIKLSCRELAFIISIIGSCALIVTFGLGYEAATHWPELGARLADPMRRWLGVQTVANMETVLFDLVDLKEQLRFKVGLATAAAPWQPQPTHIRPTATQTPTPIATLALHVAYQTLGDHLMTTPTTAPPTATPTMTPMPTPTVWQPLPIKPYGKLDGEGQWTAYIQNSQGQTVAYRTFLQPDPDRPYTIVAVVAIDLSQTQLHFVLGSEDIATAGKIAAEDKVAGKLLATFNGGFKTVHGNFGEMADGVVLLPPIERLATIAMYEDGMLRLGEWGSDILATDKLRSWRQNAKLVVQNGLVTDLAQLGSLADWHGTVEGEVVTWRSGIGLNADRQLLYYFAGPSLSMPILGQSMVAVGVFQGMLLDINPSWVDFTAIEFDDKKFHGVPLMSKGMAYAPNRFLSQYARDFFYVTAK
jgi:hypothetical protein